MGITRMVPLPLMAGNIPREKWEAAESVVFDLRKKYGADALSAIYRDIAIKLQVELSDHTEMQRGLVDALEECRRELRQERGLKALLANGMPPTGNPAFDEILATHPVAAMIQRGWLQGVTGFDDLPALESAICHFWGVKTIEEAVNPQWVPALCKRGDPCEGERLKEKVEVLTEALGSIVESAEDGRPIPEWLTERIMQARAALSKVRQQ